MNELPAKVLNDDLGCQESPRRQPRARDGEIFERVQRRVERGRFQLPNLPTTGMRVISLSNDPGVEFQDIARAISTDPVLSSELLKTANSALFSPRIPIESIRDGVSLLGIRHLRSLIFAASLRSTIMGADRLESFAHEVWRQAYSGARIAKAIAPHVGFQGDRAFLLGLLHDIGRVPLLGILREESKDLGRPSVALVGRVFYTFHEQVGAGLAATWKLGEELGSVAGCHHRFKQNEDYPRSAALASLAHRLDLLFTHEGDGSGDDQYRFPEMDFLGLGEEPVFLIFRDARDAFEDAAHEYHGEEAASDTLDPEEEPTPNPA